MARVKYWGLTVVKDIPEGILVSMRSDGKFVINQKTSGKNNVLHVFNPGDILDAGEKTLEKNFKKYISHYTDERVYITPDVKDRLIAMQKRLKR